jgi:RHS repeat-associated protein
MELDLGWSDFGVRCFDNWKARWEGIDILAEYNAGTSPYAYTLGNPIRFSDPTGMISEDQDGLMQVSTDLWGGGRNQNFMNQSAAAAAQRAETTRNRQAGYIVRTGSGTGIGTGSGIGIGTNNLPWYLTVEQYKKDLTTYEVDFNKHAGEEVMRELVDNGVDISYRGKFVTREIKPNDNMLFKSTAMISKFYNMKNAAYAKLAYDAYSIGKFSATVGKIGQVVGYAGFVATGADYYYSYLKKGGNIGVNPRTTLAIGDLILNRVGVNSPQGFLINLGWELGKAGGRYKNHLERKWAKGGEDGLITTDF